MLAPRSQAAALAESRGTLCGVNLRERMRLLEDDGWQLVAQPGQSLAVRTPDRAGQGDRGWQAERRRSHGHSRESPSATNRASRGARTRCRRARSRRDAADSRAAGATRSTITCRLTVVRGEVFRLPSPRRARGHEQRGARYAVVAQADEFLALSTVLISPTSTGARAASFRPSITSRDRRRECSLNRPFSSILSDSARRPGASTSPSSARSTKLFYSSWVCKQAFPERRRFAHYPVRLPTAEMPTRKAT